ncbi:uncharacterized protein LOC135834580 [Planococcus citri]|uniref:uncharacterized protein LOC135834580 n=1 Tax=Planococcus citri TaxID=170843 RepID=UPI0031F9AF49
MKYTILLPLLFILQHIAIKGANDVLEGKYRIDITGRPATIFPPLQNYNVKLTKQGSGKDYPVAVSRHHIIPFNHLTKFYNKLVQKGEASKLRSFLTKFDEKFGQFYRQKAVNEGNKNKYDSTIQNVHKFIQGLYYNKIVYDSSARRPENFDEFQGYYAWLPGNLFIGPNKRSDDPHEGFEKNAKVIVGARRFENLKNVYDWMQAYVDGKKVDFDKLSNGMRDIANFLEPQALKSGDWVRNQDGSYKIKA